MANFIIPTLLIAMFPLDLVASLFVGVYPSQGTLGALGGAFIGGYLARKLWNGGAQRLETESRLRLVSERGTAFDPQSEEARLQSAITRSNYLLGAGLLLFGIIFTLSFIGSYLVVTPIAVQPSPIGRLVQLSIMVLFNLIVIAIEAFGAKVFLKR